MSDSAAVQISQNTRYVRFQIDVPDTDLNFQSMKATESISSPFLYEVELVSEDHNIDIVKLLGEPATIVVVDENSGDRSFNGLISEIYYDGTKDRFAIYKAVVRPWFWFLTKTSDCKIFQNKTVPDIVKEVFRGFGFTDFRESLSGSYRNWEYCVQYRESAFNFVSRLLEQEGIYYFFEHEEGKHTLVLADSLAAHQPCFNSEEIPYFPPDFNALRDRDYIDHWRAGKALQSGKVTLNDYNYEKTNSPLKVQSAVSRNHSLDTFEVYDYPGEYETESEGNDYVRRRIEELQVQHENIQGSGNALQISAGYLFSLTNYPRDDQNQEYLVVSTDYEITDNSYISGQAGFEYDGSCSCRFSVTASREQYRPRQATQKPIVQGPQTAVVVGQGEIHTNEYGSVKIQFHWDRYGELDDNSSCWVRVSQNWAGKDWGSVSLPHIGHEVIVEHLEGDPDRPIITGRVYNSSNKPPDELPKCKTQTTWHCYGDNYITMEGDTNIQSIVQYSPTFNTQVTLGALTLVNDNSITIGGYTCCTEGDHTENTDGNHKEKTLLDKIVDVGGAIREHVKHFEHKTILGWTSAFIGGFKTEIVMGYSTKLIDGTKTEVTKGRTFKHDKSKETKITDDQITNKSPVQKEFIEVVSLVAKEDVKRIKERYEIEADKWEQRAKQVRQVADKVEQKIDEKLENISGELRTKAASIMQKCDKLTTKAGKNKVNADTDHNHGACTIKK